jgi:hypothetical protein
MIHNHNDYNPGDRVKVINSDSSFSRHVGIVTERKRYVIVVDMDGYPVYFMSHELMKEGK